MSQIVHCPKCHSSVSIASEQAGQRVQCPSCLKSFIAPVAVAGTAGTTDEDEDWLSLATESSPSPVASSAPVSTNQPAAPTDELGFADDPFETTAGQTTASQTTAGQSDLASTPHDIVEDPVLPQLPDDDNLFADLPAIDAPGGSGSVATDRREEREFRVKCSICNSVLYAKVSQVGTTLRCPDCHSDIRVPEPPKKTEPPTRSTSGTDLQMAEPSAIEKVADPYKRSAEDLLREAEKEPSKSDHQTAYDSPDTVGWLKTVFSIFLDTGVLAHIMGLSLLIALPAALTAAIPILAIGMFPLGLLGATLTISCGFAILNSVANEMERVEDWPVVDPPSWFESLSFVVAAAAIAVGPAYIVSMLFHAEPIITIGFVLFAIYMTFPFLLLSMLDMQSITTPFSQDVAKSVTRCQEDWGAFYFSSGFLFAMLFAYCLTYFAYQEATPSSVGVGVVLAIVTVFMYFAMLGRLAIAIGEVVELSGLDWNEEDDDADE